MLRLQGVCAGYGRTEVLHSVDLAVPTGATVALLGANGAGKTTLLHTVAGLLRPSAGEILVDGSPVQADPAWRRTRSGLCLIPEGRGIFRQLTVRENLAMFHGGGHPRTTGPGGRDPTAAIAAAVDAFPILEERLRQVAGTLSGGQQQMLAVARALASDAPLILADELSVGLAPVIVDEIFAAVARLRAEGRTLLIVEQYVDRALSVADYVYILHKGRIAFVGDPIDCQQQQIFDQYLGTPA